MYLATSALPGMAASAPLLRASARRRSAKIESGGSRDPPEPCFTCANDCATLHEATRQTRSSQAATFAMRGLLEVRPRESHHQHCLPAASRAAEGAHSRCKHGCNIACAQPTVDTHALLMPAHAPGPRATAEAPQRPRVRGRRAKPARLSFTRRRASSRSSPRPRGDFVPKMVSWPPPFERRACVDTRSVQRAGGHMRRSEGVSETPSTGPQHARRARLT